MIRIIYSDVHYQHQPRAELYDGREVPYAEVADRVDSILGALEDAHALGTIQPPEQFPIDHIAAIHSRNYIDFLRTKSQATPKSQQIYPSYFLTDTYAPITRGTYNASVDAVNCVLTAARTIADGERVVYSLCRPPGHHAAHQSMGGYCYFNNAAIAAHYLSRFGTVAILDIDYHHGNGTQAAFYERADIMYVSLHANPRNNYPYISGYAHEQGAGAGKGFNLNLPLPKSTTTPQYLQTLGEAIEEIERFKPRFLIVSAGFDTYAHDPIGGLRLTVTAYKKIGRLINDMKLPTLIIQEGGYYVPALGQLVVNFLRAFIYHDEAEAGSANG